MREKGNLSFTFDLSVGFVSRLAQCSIDLRVINNDFERQPRIRRGQIDTIDQAMEKWPWHT